MKTFWTLALGTLFSLSLVPQLGAAPQFGPGRERNQSRDRVCFYKDIRYQGPELCYSAGDEVSNLNGQNNSISSLRVFGRARVTVYEDTNFKGRSAEFTSDVADLGLRSVSGSRSWSDHIQSVRVSSNNDGRYGSNPPNRYPEPQQVNQGVCVYDRPDFQGRSQCWSVGENLSDLGRAGNWSDRISSIRVFGRAVVVLYRDIGFRGQSVTVDQDISDLGRLSGQGFRDWDRQASSLQVENERGRNRGIGRGRPWR